MAFSLCSRGFLFLLFLLSAVPVAYIIHSETSDRAAHVYAYRSKSWLRECAKWDDLNSRFVVSFFEGGVGVLPVKEDGAVLEEVTVVGDGGLGKNASLGIVIDRPRNRLLVAIADAMGNRYSALAAYDLTSWNRLFLTQLAGPGDSLSLSSSSYY